MQIERKTLLTISYKDLNRIKRIKEKALAKANGDPNAHGDSNKVGLGDYSVCYTVDPQKDKNFYKHISIACKDHVPDRTVSTKILQAFGFIKDSTEDYTELTVKQLIEEKEVATLENIRIAITATPNNPSSQRAYHFLEVGLEEKEYPDLIAFLKQYTLQMETFGPDTPYTIFD